MATDYPSCNKQDTIDRHRVLFDRVSAEKPKDLFIAGYKAGRFDVMHWLLNDGRTYSRVETEEICQKIVRDYLD